MAKVILGDVVDHIKDKVDKDTTDLEFYVGGEHIDGDEIMIRRKGLIQGSTIGPAFHMRFRQGDVLLMSRNPHLRKASMVDFDGICSDVSYVCRTKDNDVLLQSLLPFILQTSEFWQFAEENKKGGLPFFLNWKDFARFEFELPSLERQKQIADLLWAMERVKNAYRELIARTDDLVKSQFIEEFRYIPKEDYRPLEEVCTLITDGTHNPPKFVDAGIPFILVSNITGNEVTYDTPKYITEETYDLLMKRTPIEKGDVLLSTVGSYGHPAVVTDDRKFAFQRHVAHLKPNREALDSRFLHTAILSTDAQEQIEVLVLGVAQKTLNLSAIKKIRIPVPELDRQKHFIAFVEQSDKSKFAAKQALKEVTDAQKALMKKIFD